MIKLLVRMLTTSRVQVLSNSAAALLARGLYSAALIDAQRCMMVRMVFIWRTG